MAWKIGIFSLLVTALGYASAQNVTTNGIHLDSFEILTLASSNIQSIDLTSTLVNGYVGGLAVSSSRIFLTNTSKTFTVDPSNISAKPQSVINSIATLATDYAKDAIFVLADANNTPISNVGGIICYIIPVSLNSGIVTTLTAKKVRLNRNGTYASIKLRSQSAIFSGYNRIVVVDGTTGNAFSIYPLTGSVISEGVIVNRWAPALSGMTWGVSQLMFNNTISIIYPSPNGIIERQTIGYGNAVEVLFNGHSHGVQEILSLGLHVPSNCWVYVCTKNSSVILTTAGSSLPSKQPTPLPTGQPSAQPSDQPSHRPSRQPSKQPASLPSCQPTCQPSKRPAAQPTNQPSMQPTGLPTLTYPFILTPINAAAQQTRIILRLFVTAAAGLTYCTALPRSTPVTSVNVITQNSISVIVNSSAGAVTVPIAGLAPSSDYDVYCYTQGFGGNGMTLAQVLQTLVRVSTLCCSSIGVSPDPPYIPEYIPVFPPTDPLFQVTLNAKPKVPILISLVISPMKSKSCPYLYGTVAANASVFPSSFQFTPKSQVLLGNFIVRGSPGCYLLTANATGNQTIYSFAKRLNIKSSDIVPPPPELSSAAFSNDGLSLVVGFSSATDLGASASAPFFYRGVFPCSSVLQFRGVSLASCIWTTNAQIVASLIGSAGDAAFPTLEIADTVIMRNRTIRAVCRSGICPFANSTRAIVAAPAAAIVPLAALSAPSFVGGCDDLVMDPTASIGEYHTLISRILPRILKENIEYWDM